MDSSGGQGKHSRGARRRDTASSVRSGLRTGRCAALAAFAALAIASSASARDPGVVHDVGRLSSASASSTTRTASSTTGAVEAAPACTTRKLSLTDVLERGGHVLLAGTAARNLVGRKVKIIFAGRRQVATARIGANGLFSTTAPLPPASVRESNGARYLAEIGKEYSLNLKLTRRLVIAPPTGSGATVTLTGEVIPPLTDPAAEIIVAQRSSCSNLVPLTRIRPSANGHFHITLTAPSDQPTVTYELSTHVRQSAHSGNDYATYSLPETVELAPTVSSVQPTVGPTPGGTTMTIRGAGFTQGATVTIGAAATSVEVKSETEILAKTAAGTGAQEVVVSDVNGSSKSGVKFTYVTPPTVTAIVPAQGSALGGSEIVITGSGFVDGSTVTIGSKATVLEEASTTEIKADTSATDAGEDQVVVTLPNGVASTNALGFTYVAPPTVTAISPAEGSTEGGTVVKITGTGFIKGSTLTIGGSAAAFVVVSATEIVAETAAASAGKDEVVVSDQYGSSRGGPSFTYLTG